MSSVKIGSKKVHKTDIKSKDDETTAISVPLTRKFSKVVENVQLQVSNNNWMQLSYLPTIFYVIYVLIFEVIEVYKIINNQSSFLQRISASFNAAPCVLWIMSDMNKMSIWLSLKLVSVLLNIGFWTIFDRSVMGLIPSFISAFHIIVISHVTTIVVSSSTKKLLTS